MPSIGDRNHKIAFRLIKRKLNAGEDVSSKEAALYNRYSSSKLKHEGGKFAPSKEYL